MKKIKLIASTTMGLESIVADELKDLGYSEIKTDNGKVEFEGTYLDIAKANINLRCADRLYLKMGEFEAKIQDELFEGIKLLKSFRYKHIRSTIWTAKFYFENLISFR